MACKYKYNNEWYSKDEVRELLLKENGINFKGELVKPEISTESKSKKTYIVINWNTADITGVETKKFNTLKEAEDFIQSEKVKYGLLNTDAYQINEKYTKQGIQPQQTNATLKESIESVKNKVLGIGLNVQGLKKDFDNNIGKWVVLDEQSDMIIEEFDTEQEIDNYLKIDNNVKKEYTQQALTNTKIAALKEAAKKYPRSLIRSEVIKIKNNVFEKEIYSVFQKVENILKDSNKALKEKLNLTDEDINSLTTEELNKLKNCYL